VWQMRRVVLGALVMAMAVTAWGKSGRTYYDEAKLARMRALIERHDWVQSQVDGARRAAEWYLQFSDEELWELVPPPGR